MQCIASSGRGRRACCEQRRLRRADTAVQGIVPPGGRGRVLHSTLYAPAPWKLAASGAAKSQRVAAQPGILEVGRAGRGELPTQGHAALQPWKLAALGRAKCAPSRRMNGVMGLDRPWTTAAAPSIRIRNRTSRRRSVRPAHPSRSMRHNSLEHRILRRCPRMVRRFPERWMGPRPVGSGRTPIASASPEQASSAFACAATPAHTNAIHHADTEAGRHP